MQIQELHHSIGEMTRLEYLSLASFCFLETLPDSIGQLKSLLELELNNTRITTLPHSIGDLKMLRKMSLLGTQIKQLPNAIGGLQSLLNLDLRGTCISELPSSIGNLKRLEILCLDGSAIRELPKAIGMLESLKDLEARFCENLEGEIPIEIGDLSFLRMLDLRSSKIRRLPTTMNQLSHLQQLCLCQCDQFEQLPELPMSLKELEFPPHLLWTTPNLSYLTNVVDLHVWGGTQLVDFTQGAPNIEWIEGLSKLERMTLCMRDAIFPPINLVTLSRLRSLEMTCVDPHFLMELPSNLERLSLINVKSPIGMSLFSYLTNLSTLNLGKCWLREVDFDNALGQQLEKLHSLDVRESKLLERLSVSRLKGLQDLTVLACPGLMEIQGTEKLELLEALFIHRCSSLERLPDLSELKKLRRVNLALCPLQNLPELRLPETCHLTLNGCGISPAFDGVYKEWKDTQSQRG
ncbi:hypothetical protein ACJRO7_024438 [Eucalyptus globulus]|uniref:Disease resistance R13L4/SHOC-2-like LRR domain-containing protein n=1 Tax=Eucalyptus globulus TaxID=34317 RepID=A0ABD3K5H5_EUCGL